MMVTSEKIVICPFTVAHDIREQAPYSFADIPLLVSESGPQRRYEDGWRMVVKVERKSLETGDYTIAGLENSVAVERKSLEDLYNTLSQNRDRFEKEFERLLAMEYAAVIVEAGFGEICNPRAFRPDWRSKLLPRSVWGTIFAWAQRYKNIHWFPMESRRLAEIATFEILNRYWKENEGRKRLG